MVVEKYWPAEANKNSVETVQCVRKEIRKRLEAQYES